MRAIIHFYILDFDISGIIFEWGFIVHRHQNIYTKIMVIIFVCFIGGIPVMHIFMPDRSFSDGENRVLQEMPEFSMKRLLKGRFTSEFERYISDQFPFRDGWVGIKSGMEKAMGKMDNNGVFLCKDGYLMQGFDAPKGESMDKKIQAVNALSDMFPDINKYFVLVPNSVKVLEDKLPKNAPVADESIYMDIIRDGLDGDIHFIDVYDALFSKRDEYIYYRTDHHWTTRGAYYAYRSIAAKMGFKASDMEEFKIQQVTDSFYGSLYSKSGYRHISPDSIELYMPINPMDYKVEYCMEGKTASSIYDMDALGKKDKYMVFLGGNYPLIRITTPGRNNRKLLIIKDSYANTLVPFLLEHYDEIYMVDPRYYTDSIEKLVRDEHIDNIMILYNVITFVEDQSILNITD